jgi:putative tributyrin esterase
MVAIPKACWFCEVELSRFGKFEFSDPRFEHDHLRFLTFQSPALRGRGDVCLFIPPLPVKQGLPLVLLLHGVYCSHWAWALKGGAHLTALEMVVSGEIPPMIVAMPSDGLKREGTGYLPQLNADYERWIVNDVPDALHEAFPQLNSESPLFLCGFSMGGFGALRLGAKHAQRFCAVSAHSSLTHTDQFEALLTSGKEELLPCVPEERSLAHWLIANRLNLPAIRFDCGTADRYLEHNRSLHLELSNEKVLHVYQEFEGGHSWMYWQTHLRDSLRFFAQCARNRQTLRNEKK